MTIFIRDDLKCRFAYDAQNFQDEDGHGLLSELHSTLQNPPVLDDTAKISHRQQNRLVLCLGIVTGSKHFLVQLQLGMKTSGRTQDQQPLHPHSGLLRSAKILMSWLGCF